MARHIRDFSALCGATFESQLGKCTENKKKFFLCGIAIQFKIDCSYGFCSWEVNKEDVTVITHVVRWEVLFFLASKVAFWRSLYMTLTLSGVKFREAMGEEISIHSALFVWHFKIALPSFYGIPTNESIIFPPFVQPTPAALKWNANSSLQMSHSDLVV